MISAISSWKREEIGISVFQIVITDADMIEATSAFTEQESKSFKTLCDGTMAEKVLALAMLVYTLQQTKNDEHNLSRNQEISRANTNLQIK